MLCMTSMYVNQKSLLGIHLIIQCCNSQKICRDITGEWSGFQARLTLPEHSKQRGWHLRGNYSLWDNTVDQAPQNDSVHVPQAELCTTPRHIGGFDWLGSQRRGLRPYPITMTADQRTKTGDSPGKTVPTCIRVYTCILFPCAVTCDIQRIVVVLFSIEPRWNY